MISVLPCLNEVFPDNLERWQDEKPCRSEIISIHRLYNAVKNLSLYMGNDHTPPVTDEGRKLSYTFHMLAGAVYDYCERHPLPKLQRK
jgi:hypothetical protein